MVTHEKKVFIVGDSNCGKTSVIRKFCNDDLPLVNLPTTLEKFVADVEINGQTFVLNIWETLCTHHYRVSGAKIRQSIYKDVDVVVIAFDISRRETLENVLNKWHNEVLLFSPRKTPIILIGNKKDKRYDSGVHEKPVDYVEGLEVAKEIGALSYLECSARTGEGIQDIFVNIGKALQKKNVNCGIL